MRKKIIYFNYRFIFQNDFMILSNFYKLCYDKSNWIFYELSFYLKANLIWFLSFKYVTQQNNIDFLILDEFEEKVLFTGKSLVVKGIYKFGVGYKQDSLIINLFKKCIWNNCVLLNVLKIIIEPIFEIHFEENSFAFRPFSSFHTAFSFLSWKMKSNLWVLHYNLQNGFSNILSSFVVKKFFVQIKDPLIMGLIKIGLGVKALKDIGVPIGNKWSSFIANIYLDSFDKWINNVCLLYLENKIHNFQFLDSSINYIRYGGSFLVSVLGSYTMAIEIQHKINNYLKKQLYILDEFINVKLNLLSNGICFLGHCWKGQFTSLNPKLQHALLNNDFLRLKINIKFVVKFLQNRNICDGLGKALPFFLYLHFSQKEANSRINEILSLFCFWFRWAFNRRYIIGFISSIFRLALAKMYAAKFKLKTTSAVWTKSGYFLNKPLSLNRKKDNTIPKILYSKYNEIANPKQS